MRFIIVLLTALLTGCANPWIIQTREQAAEIADGILSGGVYATCEAPTAASLRRRYGKDPEGAAAWTLFCEYELNNMEVIEIPSRRLP